MRQMNMRRWGGRTVPGAALLAALAGARPALAHGVERGIVLLLPGGHVTLGGAAAVGATFVALALIPARWLQGLAGAEVALFRVAPPPRAAVSLLSFVVLAVLVATGFLSVADPLSNPLPLVIWTGWWVGFLLLQAVTGDLWPWVNPWTGPLAVLARLTGGRLGARPLLALPARLGSLPALVLYLAFAWVELVSLAPEDPPRLARLVALYWAVTFAAMTVFGEAVWAERGEPFSVFFRLIGRLAPFHLREGRLWLAWPGRRMLTAPALSLSATLFVLTALGTVSFDGFDETFLWLGFIGVNPLEFPGRSAVMVPGTLGLLAAPVLLAGLFFGAVALGVRIAGGGAVLPVAGRLVLSVIPIALAFHAAHYLGFFLINSQYLWAAASDPFARGWDLFGTAHHHVSAAFTMDFAIVARLWAFQTGVIVAGHVLGILIAHLIALDHFGTTRRAAASQLPLAAVMVFYTLFGLWLLSTPTAG